jgi:Holliday junction resolvase RusA-like endonuclease
MSNYSKELWELHMLCLVKPLSINAAYTLKRKKSAKYRKFEELMALELFEYKIPDNRNVAEMRFKLDICWGFATSLSDVDNPIKTLLDVLQRWFGFDDKQIMNISATKKVVGRGKEYIGFTLTEI